jgi:hypothetical protein
VQQQLPCLYAAWPYLAIRFKSLKVSQLALARAIPDHQTPTAGLQLFCIVGVASILGTACTYFLTFVLVVARIVTAIKEPEIYPCRMEWVLKTFSLGNCHVFVKIQALLIVSGLCKARAMIF